MRVHAVFSLLVATTVSAAPSKEVRECVAASEVAQRLRDELHFRDARQKLLRCADEHCPSVVQADCAKWLTQLQADQPSLVVATRVGEKDSLELPEVELDGQPLELLRLGQPLEADPGPHRVRVTLADGRTLVEELVLGVGEKNRRVVFSFPAPAPAAVLTPVPAAEPKLERKVVSSPPPIVPVVLTGVSVGAGITFGVLAVLGRNALAEVEKRECATTRSCDPALLGPTRSLYLGADVAAVIGLTTAALAIWQWIAWSPSNPSAPAPTTAPGPLTWQF